MLVAGLNTAATSTIGFHIGRNDVARAEQLYSANVKVGMTLIGAQCLLFALFGHHLCALFTPLESVRQ